MASRTVDSPESRSGMARPWRRHRARSSASCSPDQPPGRQSGHWPCRQSGQSRSGGPLACARYCARHSRCMECRLHAGKGTASWAPSAAGERRSRQTQQHSSARVGGAMGVVSPAGGSFVEAELTESGDRGARTRCCKKVIYGDTMY